MTGINSEGDVCRIRPLQGGSERTVHRKLIKLHPSEVSDRESSEESSSDEELVQGTCEKGVDTQTVWEGPPAQRRSNRSTRGIHSNPHRLPRSVSLK